MDFFSTVFRMDARDVIRELQKAGLDSIPGGGGEILVQRVRDLVAKKKAGADRWLDIMEMAHQEGMKTSVTMMYGIGETLEERLEHLRRVKEVAIAHGWDSPHSSAGRYNRRTLLRCPTNPRLDAVGISAHDRGDLSHRLSSTTFPICRVVGLRWG